MNNNMPDGTWISYTYKGEKEYAQIANNGTCIEIGGTPTKGTLVQPCVWKNGDFEPRGAKKEFL